MSLALKDIESFGGIDADTDHLLDECFEDHEAFKQILEQRRFLVIGRKGSGKTAIYRKLLKLHRAEFLTFGHAFRDYPWHHHNLQRVSGVPEHECFSQSWKYLILITLSKMLLNHDQSQPWSEDSIESIGAIESFVIDSYGTRDPDVSQVFQPQTQLKLNSKFKIGGFGVEASISPQLLPIGKLPLHAQEVNSNIQKAVLNAANPNNSYFVLFDELDLGFSKQDADYPLRLIGLINAARSLNLASKDAGRKVSIVVFLRDDIYEMLKFEDKNKITESGLTRIEWDGPSAKHSLKDLMARRISKLVDVPPPDAWGRVFDEDQKMRGRQTKYNHMLDRTMLRPRDMIKFCNQVLEEYRRSPSQDKFRNEDVIAARKGYSDYLYRELEDEVHQHLNKHEGVFEALRDLYSVSFTASEFELIFASRPNLFPSDVGAIDVLAGLFECSIVGYYQPGGAGYGGAEYVFKYKSPQAKFNGSADKFQVHLGLQEALGLRRYGRGQAGDGNVAHEAEDG